MSDVTVGDLEAAIRNVPDFPQPGIQFKDITPVLGDARLFAGAVDLMAARHADAGIDACVGIDARGFIFAAAAAKQLGTGFVPIRKQGKLPWKTHEESYSLEYGEATIAIHQDALQPGARVLLLDDLLATGGTAAAAANLLQKIGAEIVEVGFMIELGFLDGREKMNGHPVNALITY